MASKVDFLRDCGWNLGRLVALVLEGAVLDNFLNKKFFLMVVA